MSITKGYNECPHPCTSTGLPLPESPEGEEVRHQKESIRQISMGDGILSIAYSSMPCLSVFHELDEKTIWEKARNDINKLSGYYGDQ